MLGGIVLLCFSAIWIVHWCEQASRLHAGDYHDDQVVFVLTAGLALIPTMWATWLIDRAWRASLEPRVSKRLITTQLPRLCIETKPKNDDQLAGLTPTELELVKIVLSELPDASVADVIAEIKSPTGAVEAVAAE